MSTNHRLRIWASRTTKQYCSQRIRKNIFGDKFFYYEFYIDCVCGPKRGEDRLPDHCSLKLVCRLNIEEKKYEVKFWESTHNHEPNPKKAKMESWVDKMKKKVASIKKCHPCDNLQESDEKLRNRVALKKISTKIEKNISLSHVDQQNLKLTYLFDILDTFHNFDEEFEESIVSVPASGVSIEKNPHFEVRADPQELVQDPGDSAKSTINNTLPVPATGVQDLVQDPGDSAESTINNTLPVPATGVPATGVQDLVQDPGDSTGQDTRENIRRKYQEIFKSYFKKGCS
ncbi:hypothetical protein KQX54_001822 [Cotesia glomerata]|uniref:Uncharacterized protein n=1 Tax=Cotesia glomerata TaxID=32391 RepID=A0AAV7HZU8_COTGL|nr:hypothetical protein KQX54_001822 [Cotesia glomerata]